MNEDDIAQSSTLESPDVAAPETHSLDDHQALFGPQDPSLDAEAKAKNDDARAKVRHRAVSQQATPEDVAAISQLTARAKAAEDAAGIAKLPNESERVYRLRVRAELAEQHGKAQQTAPPARDSQAGTAGIPPVEAGASRPAAQGPAFEPTRPKPTEDDIGVGLKYESYGAYVDDLTDWKAEQRDAKREAAQQAETQQRQQQEAQQAYQTAYSTYHARLREFVKTHPDYSTLLAQHSSIDLPPAVNKAILSSENGPAFVYHLVQHPDVLADVVLLFEGKPPSDQVVALATSWLSRRAQAVVTGSAAPPPPLTLAARPPNPVRTGASRSDSDLPGDESSLAEHEKAFGHRRR